MGRPGQPRRVNFLRTATFDELTAHAEPSALANRRHEESLDAGPASRFLRDGLAAAATDGAPGRVVETIFLDRGRVVAWLGCSDAGYLRSKDAPPHKDAWPAVFKALAGRALDGRVAQKPRHATKLEMAPRKAIAWCDDGSGGLGRYGLCLQELELLCCLEHAHANGEAHFGAWAPDSRRATSARGVIVALQRYEPPPLACKGCGVFVQSFERARPRPAMTAVELKLAPSSAT